jgi:hypothetical protein
MIVLRKLNFFLKDILKYSKNILRIKQWFKGAHVIPNKVVGPNYIKNYYDLLMC